MNWVPVSPWQKLLIASLLIMQPTAKMLFSLFWVKKIYYLLKSSIYKPREIEQNRENNEVNVFNPNDSAEKATLVGRTPASD